MMNLERRVVITGMGALSCMGNSVADMWASLKEGKSGLSHITKFDATGYRCQIAGEVKNLNLDEFLSPKEQKRLDPYCHYAVVAAAEAFKNAGLEQAELDPMRSGVLISSGIGGLSTIVEQTNTLNERGTSRVSPLLIPMMISNMASGYIALKYNFCGVNFSIASACASGLHSIGEAYWIIKRGDADVMLSGGAEATMVPLGYSGFGSMRALSERNDSPETASRPFDKDRDGFVPSEGSGVVVLEEYEHAVKRNAPIIAEIAGYGATCDAHHITAPRADGLCAAAAIGNALKQAQLPKERIEYINAHGTSTPLNDSSETIAIKRALGEFAYHVPVSSTKSMMGHTLGAAGALETIICARTLQTGIIPPTINQFTPDPECDLDYVPNCAREKKVSVALNLSLGFGGHNAALLLKSL